MSAAGAPAAARARAAISNSDERPDGRPFAPREVAPPAAGRPSAIPPNGFVRRLGAMAALLARSLAALVSRPFAWRREFLLYSLFILRRCLPPLALAVAAWGFSGPGLQAGNFLSL